MNYCFCLKKRTVVTFRKGSFVWQYITLLSFDYCLAENGQEASFLYPFIVIKNTSKGKELWEHTNGCHRQTNIQCTNQRKFYPSPSSQIFPLSQHAPNYLLRAYEQPMTCYGQPVNCTDHVRCKAPPCPPPNPPPPPGKKVKFLAI
jgi:hypothetical protein